MPQVTLKRLFAELQNSADAARASKPGSPQHPADGCGSGDDSGDDQDAALHSPPPPGAPARPPSPRFAPAHRVLCRRALLAGGRGLSGENTRISLARRIPRFTATPENCLEIRSATDLKIPPFSVAYNNGIAKDGKLLAVADEEGFVQILDTRRDLTESYEKIECFQAHDNAVFEVDWFPGDQELITVAGDHSARVWDVEHKKLVNEFVGHSSSVKSVSINHENRAIIATASRDGSIGIWDRRVSGGLGASSGRFRNAHIHSLAGHGSAAASKGKRRAGPAALERTTKSVTSVLFLKHHTDYVVSAGATDGMLKMWDIRSISHARHHPVQISDGLPHSRPHGFSSLTLDTIGTRIYATCLDSSIYEFSAYDISHPLRRLSAPSNTTSFWVKAALAPNDQFLLSGSSDSNAYIWDLNELSSSSQLPAQQRNSVYSATIHHKEVTSVAWCRADFGQFATCSDDSTVRIWNMSLGSDGDACCGEDEPTAAARRNPSLYGSVTQIECAGDAPPVAVLSPPRRSARQSGGTPSSKRARVVSSEDGVKLTDFFSADSSSPRGVRRWDSGVGL